MVSVDLLATIQKKEEGENKDWGKLQSPHRTGDRMDDITGVVRGPNADKCGSGETANDAHSSCTSTIRPVGKPTAPVYKEDITNASIT